MNNVRPGIPMPIPVQQIPVQNVPIGVNPMAFTNLKAESEAMQQRTHESLITHMVNQHEEKLKDVFQRLEVLEQHVSRIVQYLTAEPQTTNSEPQQEPEKVEAPGGT